MSGGIDIATAGWPLAATLAATLTALAVRAGRRRSALNEAVHELRRPLQALTLAVSGPRPAAPVAHSSLRLAGAALERLDREINGGAPARTSEPVRVEELIVAAADRWRARVSAAGGSLWVGGVNDSAGVDGDPAALAQALDNLIVNAIEHGGPRIVVGAEVRRGRLLLSVCDRGRDQRPLIRRESPLELVARLSGRRRHGHGLAVVRATAAAHGGRFVLRRATHGSRAVIELPLEGEGTVAA